MSAPVILLVEDNAITRKLVRFTLQNQGFEVLEAQDGKTALEIFASRPVSLVLQDLCLPDMSGFDLGPKLRALPGGADVPMLVFSGMISRQDEARVSQAGFDDLITKPIEPSKLLQIVRAYLPSGAAAGDERFGQGKRIVVADDDPVQRKLVAFRMQKLGFEVASAADGDDALRQIRADQPDIVLSDVLMPGVDGFGLCMELRRDPKLSKIPVVLATNSYVEETDRDLARRSGAQDLVIRTPELREVVEALQATLQRPMPAVTAPPPPPDVDEDHTRRMVRQLERQVTMNARISQRCALLGAEMAVLRGISEALTRGTDIDEALEQTLAACFDAGGISLGALYLYDGPKLRVLSFGFPRGWGNEELLDFFGERALLEQAMSSPQTTLLQAGAGGSSEAEQRALARAQATSVLLVPLGHRGTIFGALAMFARNGELQQEDRIKFGEAVAGQISLAMAMTGAFRAQERSEHAAREQASLLRSVLDSISDGIAVVDDKREVIVWNSAAGDIVELVSVRDPSELPTDQGLFDVDAMTRLPLDRLSLERISRGEVVDGNQLFVRHRGAPEGAWIEVMARPWHDDQGVVRGGVIVFRDVTREKATQSQLMVSDRMASVGMLAAGVAHEINNPLACVVANVELAELELAARAGSGALGDVTELREMLRDAREGGSRVRQIVKDLRIFSRHEDTGGESVNVEKVLDSSTRMAWNEIRHRAELIKEYGKVPLVAGSESRLGQVFLNLIMNAAQAIPEGNASNHVVRISTSVDGEGRIVVSIADTGSGIPEQSLKQLFRAFYTTKAPGVGTGLGLAISHRIIKDLGGEIRVQSQVGKGTTFTVVLSPAHGDDKPDSGPLQVARPAQRRGNILVVDDEAMMATVVARTLSKEHDVVATEHAGEALAKIQAGARYDLILCDLMMPQMTGMDLHAALLVQHPDQARRMVFLTGGAFTHSARSFLESVPNKRIEKPFDAQHLRALVNELLK